MPGDLERYADQYFTGTQASIFVGDIWVDECFGIQFHATQSIVPVYGYASRFFDMVAAGKVLVQGVFEINFIDEGYLFAVLEEAQERLLNARFPDAKRTLADQVKEKLDLLNENIVDRAFVGPELPAREILPNDDTIPHPDPRDSARWDTMGSVLNDLANMSIVDADQLGSRLVDVDPPQPTRSVIYKVVPFKLMSYFGNPVIRGKEQGSFKELRDCFLVSNEMIVGSNDEVVKERYSFICRQHV